MSNKVINVSLWTAGPCTLHTAHELRLVVEPRRCEAKAHPKPVEQAAFAGQRATPNSRRRRRQMACGGDDTANVSRSARGIRCTRRRSVSAGGRGPLIREGEVPRVRQ